MIFAIFAFSDVGCMSISRLRGVIVGYLESLESLAICGRTR